MPSAVPQLLAPFLSLLEALDAERPRGSRSHDLEAEKRIQKHESTVAKKNRKCDTILQKVSLNKILQVVVFLSFLKPKLFLKLSIR